MTGQIYTSYSFLDVQAEVVAPGFTFDLASAGVSNEGIRISMVSEKDVMTIGAAGDGMHTLVASNAARAEVSLLKEAPANAMMNALYNSQNGPGGAAWGNIQITVTNNQTGDSVVLVGGAISKQADISYGTEATLNVWSFNFIQRRDVLGNGFNERAIFAPVS